MMPRILPGVILGYSNRKYYLIGINTNIIVKLGDDQTSKDQQSHRIAVRFTKNISDLLTTKINEIKANPNLSHSYLTEFSGKLFRLLDNLIASKNIFFYLLKDNCKLLLQNLNLLKNDENLKLTKEEKAMLNIFTDNSPTQQS